MGGRVGPGGLWEYGRVELVIDGVWTVLADRFRRSEDIGRQGAQVLCRSLGYGTGAKIVVGRFSPFPAPLAVPDAFPAFSCNGTELALSDCDVSFPRVSNDYGAEFIDRTVGVLCTTPSGVVYWTLSSLNSRLEYADTMIRCNPTANPSAKRRRLRTGCEDTAVDPQQGDVRLVPFDETATPTASCDDVHFGGVELFREGLWGRICEFGLEEFTIDAQVVCRQLGFPFGTVMEAGFSSSSGDYRTDDTSDIAWASTVRSLETPHGMTCESERPLDPSHGAQNNLPADVYISFIQI